MIEKLYSMFFAQGRRYSNWLNGSMAYYLLIFANLLICSSAHSQIYFSTPIDVGSTSSLQGYRPRIAVVNDTTPIVTWAKSGSAEGLYFSEWTYSPTFFDTPQDIFPAGTGFYAGVIDGPDMMVSGDTVYIAVWTIKDTLNHIALCRSFDGGNSFVDTNIVYTTIKRLEFPSIAKLGDGSIGIAFQRSELDETANEMMFTKSYDAGETWNSPQVVSTLNPGEPCECCPLNLCASGNYAALTYRNNMSHVRDFYAAVSTDNGNTFTSGFPVDTSGFYTTTCPITGIDGVIVGDTLYNVFTTRIGALYQIKLGKTGLNDTVNFNDFLFPSSSAQNHPTIAASGDTLAVVYQQNATAQDIFFAYKIGNDPWSVPVNITNASGNQTTPDIAIRHGYFHIVYFDQSSANRPRYIHAGFEPITLGLNEHKETPLFYAFPNPYSNDLRLTGTGTFLVTDLAGKRIFSGDLEQTRTSLLSVPRGVYLVQNESGQQFKLVRL